jgi:virginiamycin B lyase
MTISDGTNSLPVSVTNAYSGVEGAPSVTYFNSGVSGPNVAQITAGPDGGMWFAEINAKIGRIDATGTSPSIVEYPMPTPDPVHLPQIRAITPGPDGKLWFAGYPYSTAIGNLATTGCATSCAEYTTPGFQNAYGIVTGSDGALWFTKYDFSGANYIDRATPDGTVTNSYSTGITPTSGVGSIVAGPDGNLWFSEFNCATTIGKITTAGTVTEYAVDYNHDVAVGPDGNIWVAGSSGVSKVTTSGTATPNYSSYQLAPTGGQTYGAYGPYRLTTGPDGAIWYIMAQPASDGQYYIARIDPSNDTVTDSISVGTGGRPEGIAAGPDGAIWFTGFNGSAAPAIGRIALQTSALRPKPNRGVANKHKPWVK